MEVSPQSVKRMFVKKAAQLVIRKKRNGKEGSDRDLGAETEFSDLRCSLRGGSRTRYKVKDKSRTALILEFDGEKQAGNQSNIREASYPLKKIDINSS